MFQLINKYMINNLIQSYVFILSLKMIESITTKYRFTSSVLRHKFFGIFSINNVRLISKLSCVNLKSTENLLINKIDNGNRQNANDMCAHKKWE